ncbi:MAG: hypothetical protein RMA76_18495 [Deltaproteobacteria bacterium]
MVWELIDSSPVPGGEGVLSLHRRDDDFAIFIDHRRLMDSRVHDSELALARLTCTADTRLILIGGLGMGLTLRAALDQLGEDARVHVAELVPAVVRWNQGPLGVVSNRALDDPRVTVVTDDVGVVMRSAKWDVILLDVDNGPEGLTRADNDHLYATSGLDAAFDALQPGGVLAVWSAQPNDAFTARLESRGFGVRVEIVRSGGLDRSDHVIWIATRP